jgi:hypothetical protein
MSVEISSRTQLSSRWLTLAHVAWYVCAVLAVIVLLGALPGYYSHYAQVVRADPNSLGGFNLSLQVLVGLSDLASSFISFALAVLLFWRKPNDRMALFASFFSLITAVVWSYALDYFLTTYFGTPSTHELWSVLLTPLGILLFCIFPDGRFVPRWTRWIFVVSIPASLSIVAGSEGRSIANVVTYPLFFLVIYAQVYRYRRVSSYAERKQTKWVVFGFVVSMALSIIASIIYKKPSPPLINILPIALTIAILRSHLWDVDFIIRKTLVYSVLTGLLALIYFGGVVLAQQLTRSVTGDSSDVAIVVLTLVIAALFFPLRRRVQNTIDRRFYRRKYDAAKTLAAFSATVRDEVELEKLTAELLNVVNETMQPASVSLWLKPTRYAHAIPSKADHNE